MSASRISLAEKRSEAAKKANETRGVEGRRNAALKAWETIRAKKKARSDAAKRAWKTRKGEI